MAEWKPILNYGLNSIIRFVSRFTIYGRVWLDEKNFAHVFREENLVRMEY